MKKYRMIFSLPLILFSLHGCQSNDYFAEEPSAYLIDEDGHFINEKGERVNQPVPNPYRIEYERNKGSSGN